MKEDFFNCSFDWQISLVHKVVFFSKGNGQRALALKSEKHKTHFNHAMFARMGYSQNGSNFDKAHYYILMGEEKVNYRFVGKVHHGPSSKSKRDLTIPYPTPNL